MSKRLLYWLNAPHAAWLDPADTPMALAALAIHTAKRDLPDALIGASEMDSILARRFDLTRREAAEMRASCEDLARAVRSGEELARLVTSHVPEGERKLLAECMSEEVRRRHPDSRRLERTLSARFGLPGRSTGSRRAV
ncbi:tellurite resistance TerB family protein [Roseivivax sp. CAU 1753]